MEIRKAVKGTVMEATQIVNMKKYIDLVKYWYIDNINSHRVYDKGKVVFVSLVVLLLIVKLFSLIF